MGIKGVYKPIVQTSWVEVSPDLSMLYSYYYQDKVEENGVEALCLQVDSADAQSIITGIGINASFKSFSEEQMIYPVSFIRYERDWFANMDDAHEVNASLKNYPDYKQTFVGQNRGSDILTLGIGVESVISSQWQVGGGIIKGWDSNGSEFSFGINAQYAF